MKRKHSKRFGRHSLKHIRQFFLACEFKPYTRLWSALDPFAYDVEPAYIYGKLGIISYKPRSYSIVTIDEDENPLLGYLITITHPDTILLLDKIKGYNGKNSFNAHMRKLVNVRNENGDKIAAWCYVLTPYVLDAYSQIEQVKFGMWDNDEKQKKLLDLLSQDVS